METVTVSTTFEGSPREMAERCHTLASRKAWPGAVLMGGGGDRLYYQVSMRLKAAAMTDIDIDETQSPIEERGDGSLAFTTRQKVSWPDGLATAETEYVLAGDQLTFTYRYEPPSTKLVKAKALPAFHQGMEKVAARYVKGLTASAVSA